MSLLLRLGLGLLCGVVVLAVSLKLSFPRRDEVPIPCLPSLLIVGFNLLLAAPWGWKVVVPVDVLILLWSLWGYVADRRERSGGSGSD